MTCRSLQESKYWIRRPQFDADHLSWYCLLQCGSCDTIRTSSIISSHQITSQSHSIYDQANRASQKGSSYWSAFAYWRSQWVSWEDLVSHFDSRKPRSHILGSNTSTTTFRRDAYYVTIHITGIVPRHTLRWSTSYSTSLELRPSGQFRKKD